MNISDCPNSTQLNAALDTALDAIRKRELTDIVHILDTALPFTRNPHCNACPILIARNLMLNAALSPRTYRAPRTSPTDPAA